MAVNSLTNLIGPLYQSLDIISRELVGAIPCVTLDAQVARAAVGQQVTSFVSPTVSATDIAPGMLPPDDGEQTFGNIQLTITKSRRVPFRWNGEQELGLNNSGVGAANLKNAQLTQALRALVNEMEVDVVTAARISASRGWGTPGSTPFATGVGDTAQLRKILDDNGAPLSDRALIIDTSAGANFRSNTQLTKANESGSTVTIRDGELLNLHGFSLHESAGVRRITPGNGSGYVTNAAAYPAGSTAITVGTGTGAINAGDVVTFAGDVNKYVSTGLSGGVLGLAAPGLQTSLPASAVAVTVVGAFTPNVAFTQSSIILATRAPALPDGGDSAVDRMHITDPRSGITFEVAMYAQYRQMQYEVSASWGVKGIKSAHTALLLG